MTLYASQFTVLRRPEKMKRSKPISEYFDRHYLRSFWREHWEIIVAAALGLIIGGLVLPKFFR